MCLRGKLKVQEQSTEGEKAEADYCGRSPESTAQDAEWELRESCTNRDIL